MRRCIFAVRPLALAALALPAACEQTPPATYTFTTRDSAGITIVESRAPLWGEGEAWRIAAEPDVVIGRAAGDERYLLDDVRGVRRFADGRIAVLDGGSSRIRVYDAEGNHLFDAGRRGEGPAEFDAPQYLDLIGDTMVVYQYGPPRASWFADDGSFVRAVSLPGAPDGRTLHGAALGLPGGDAFLITAAPPGRPARSAGRAREALALWKLPLDGSPADSLMRLDAEEIVVHTSGGWNDLVFGKTTYVTASPRRIWVGPSDRYAIREHAPDGELERVLRRSVEPRPVVPSDLDRWVEQSVAAAQGDPANIPAIRERFREMGTADVMPAFRMLAADSEDNLWVEDWDDVGIEQGAFSVLRAEDGAWLGRVELPPRLPSLRARNLWTSPLVIGDDWLLGVWTDGLGVEQVRLYSIEKPTSH